MQQMALLHKEFSKELPFIHKIWENQMLHRDL